MTALSNPQFWIGIILGMWIGCTIGVLAMGLLVSARRNDQ